MAVDTNTESLSSFITFVLVRQKSNSNSATPQTCKTLAVILMTTPEFKNLAQQIDLVDLLYGNTKLSSIKL